METGLCEVLHYCLVNKIVKSKGECKLVPQMSQSEEGSLISGFHRIIYEVVLCTVTTVNSNLLCLALWCRSGRFSGLLVVLINNAMCDYLL